jgi:DNA-binding LacI/PurR family transcriptional regulator
VAKRPAGSRPSIRDVARAAGVSTTTASDAINGRGRCSSETRARVAFHAEQLGYRANPSARNMRSSSTGIVALVTRIEHEAAWSAGDLEFLTRITQEFSSAAWDLGYFPTLVPSLATPRSLDRLPLEGMIVVDPIGDDAVCQALDQRGIPYVCVSPSAELRGSGRCGWVDTDTQTALRRLLDDVRASGVTHALMVATQSQQTYLTDPVDAFRRWSEETGVPGRTLLLPSGSSAEFCYDAVYSACTDDAAPVDLVCIAAEGLAQPTLQAVRQSGRRVPEQLQVIAVSDALYARSAMPDITCLDLKPETLGRTAIDMLHGLIIGSEPADLSMVVDAEIHWRSSSRPAPVSTNSINR